MNMLSRTILAANCLSAAVAVAVQPGDVLQFAADGGLREVTLVHRTSPTTYIGSLDGYGDSLNATVAETADGWTMSIDDWRTRRMWRVVADANGLDVTIEDKALRPRNRSGNSPFPAGLIPFFLSRHRVPTSIAGAYGSGRSGLSAAQAYLRAGRTPVRNSRS